MALRPSTLVYCTQPGGFLANGGILPGPGGIQTFPSIAAQRGATSAFIPVNQKDPKSIDWTLGVQHSFGSNLVVEVRYVGTRGIHLPAQVRLNTEPVVTTSNQLPTYLTNTPNQAALDASTNDLGILESINPIVPAYNNAGFNGSFLTAYEPWASSTYHGLAVQANKKFSHGVSFVGAYTWSHNIDDATAEVFSTVLAPRRAQDGLNLSADRGNSILDHRHRVTFSVVYDEPFFKNSGAFLRNTLGGWEVAPIYTFQSGQWVTTTSGVDSNLNLDSAGDRVIANPGGVKGTGSGTNPLCRSVIAASSCNNANVLCTGDPTIDASGCTPGIDVVDNVVGYQAVNPNAQFIQANYGTVANVGRAGLQLPAINDFDVTALKRFTITERFRVEFRASATNVLNHPQYIGGFLNDVGPIGFTGAEAGYAQPQNGSFNQPSAFFSSNPRVMTLALKIFF